MTVEIRAAEVADVSRKGRTITLLAIPYNRETDRVWDFEFDREKVLPGAFDGIEQRSGHVTANREHRGERTIGKVSRFDAADARGLVVDMAISRTPLGDESLELAADDVLRGSVGMIVRRSDATIKDRLRTIRRVDALDHVALVPSPAYLETEVLGIRERTPREPIATPNLDEVLRLLHG